VERHLRISEEERRLARRFAAMTQHAARAIVKHVTSIKLANPIIAQPGELSNRESAGFVMYQTQRQIQALPVSRVPVI
jgi:hypothetical protein